MAATLRLTSLWGASWGSTWGFRFSAGISEARRLREGAAVLCLLELTISIGMSEVAADAAIKLGWAGSSGKTGQVYRPSRHAYCLQNARQRTQRVATFQPQHMVMSFWLATGAVWLRVVLEPL